MAEPKKRDDLFPANIMLANRIDKLEIVVTMLYNDVQRLSEQIKDKDNSVKSKKGGDDAK